MKRLQKFATADELDLDSVDRNPRGEPAVSVEDGTFAWEKDAEPTLKELSFYLIWFFRNCMKSRLIFRNRIIFCKKCLAFEKHFL